MKRKIKTKVIGASLIRYSVFILILSAGIFVGSYLKSLSTKQSVLGEKINTTGFNEFGYNYTARLFNGTGESWSLAKGLPADHLGIYAPDKIVMKWNAEWDRGNAENWDKPPYSAWENNEWNGKVPGGSGEVWHYKIKWVGACGADSTKLPDGGYCIWGQFEVIFSQGTVANEHFWETHAKSPGYGVK